MKSCEEELVRAQGIAADARASQRVLERRVADLVAERNRWEAAVQELLRERETPGGSTTPEEPND